MGPRPQAGHRKRSALHHKTSIGCEWFAGGVSGAEARGGESWFIVTLSYRERGLLPKAPLVVSTCQCYGAAMYTLARLLQMVGLTIPVLAILAQLNESITASKMLGFLVASVLIFLIGYTLQRSSGGPR